MGTRGTTFSGEELRSILLLMKKRSSANAIPNREIFTDSNTFLRDGILVQLMKEIRGECDGMKAEQPPAVDWERLRLKAEILFFSLYQTQATDEESQMLLVLVRDISDFIISVVGVQPGSSSENQTVRKLQQEATKPLFHLLVILQLAHLAAHQQTVKLYDRERDYIDSHDIEKIEIGNSLEQSAGSKYGLDRDSWHCRGAKAFTSLVFAVFRQPEVDSDRANPADVEWFLHEACILRGYSYIRLCVLPIIQAQALVDYEGSLFYYSILADLMENLSEIFRMSHYRHHESHEDFPYEFFPPTMEFYQENIAFYNDVLSRNKHSRSSPSKRSSTNPSVLSSVSHATIDEVDTLEDVVLAFIDLMKLYPVFTQMFWGASETDLCHSTEDLLKSSCHPHHFVGRFLRCCHHYPSLSIPTLHLLAALGDGPGGTTARLVFQLIDDPSFHHWSWQRFLTGLEDICGSLKPETTPAIAQQMLGAPTNGNTPQGNLKMTSVDIPGLLAVLELIRSVSRHCDIAEILQTRFNIIDLLFIILSCALPIDVKGAVFRCLAVFAEHSKDTADKIWNALESFNEVKENSNYNGTTVPQSNILQGLKAELEEREVRNGQFPLSDGFLQLIISLLKHGIPIITFGQQNGFLSYIEFVIEDILLKGHQRRYSPDTPTNSMAQRWKSTSRSIEILSIVIANYHVDSTEEKYLRLFSSDFQEADSKHPKSAGFFVIATILSNSNLTKLLMQFLQHLDQRNLQDCLREHLVSEWSNVLETLRMGFAVTSKQSKKSLSVEQLLSNPTFSLSMQRRDSNEANCVFWAERALANIISLLYEISVKEKSFLDKVKQCGEQLFIRKVESGRFLHIPLNPYNLSGIIAGNFITKSLAQLISIEMKTVPIVPSVNVIAVKLLEYLCTQKATWNPLSSSSVDRNSEINFLSSSEIIEGFSRALLLSATEEVFTDGFGEYLSMFIGGEKSPVRSHSLDNVRTTLRDSIISLLLTTLNPNQFTFSHELLGLHQQSPFQNLSNKPFDCFDALLTLLRPYQNNFFQQHPWQAMKCYELLYRLSQSHLTRNSTLARLRQKQLDFFRGQLSFLLRLMSLDLPDLIPWINTKDSVQNKVGDLFIAISNSVACLLKICTLELVECQRRESDVHIITSTNQIIAFLLGDCGLDGKKSLQADQIVLVRILEFAISDVANTCNLIFTLKASPQLFSADASAYSMQENLKSSVLAAADHLCVSWRQLADLLYLSPYYRTSVVEKYGAEAFSHVTLREILLPITRLTAKSHNCTVVVKEQLCSTFSSFLNAAISSKAPLRGILSDEDLLNLVEHWIALIIANHSTNIRANIAPSTLCMELGEISVTFIANISSCLNLLVIYLNREFPNNVDSLAGVIFRKYSVQLLDVLIQVATKGDNKSKLIALSAMLTLQQFCNVFDDQNDQRSNIIQLNFIETMKNKSYVESLLTCSRLCTSSQEVSEDDLTLFTATVGFIIKLADSKDGCSLLVQSSLFQKLYDAIYFRRFASLGRTEKMYENAKYKSFVEAVSTTFQLFNFILQRHAASMQVLHPISIYIRKNNAMIAHVLNLRDSNLAMLELAEIITRCLIAFSTKLMQIPEATGESTGNKLMSKLVNLLGEDMNATVQDCQTLISILDFHVILDPRYGQSSNWSWLPAVKVAVDSTDYIKETVSISANNSLLNMRKVHAASGIVLNVLSFLRLITQESQSLVLQVKTLEVVAALFCAAGAALIDDASDENARRTKSAPAASQNCQDIAENCICIFYNLAVTSDKTVRAELHKLQCMQQVLNCSSYFPSQAFIGIVGRWIRERLEQTQ